MNKILLVFLTSLSPFLQAALPSVDNSSDISSNYASFDGDHLHLSGNVSLYHDLGNMHAQKATVKRGEKETPFTEMTLSDHVSFAFQNNSELFCDEAELDFILKVGKVLSKDGRVLYRNRQNGPLDLFSRQIDFQFVETDDKVLEVEKLLATEGVHIDYSKNYHLDSDQALFENEKVSTFGFDPSSLCHLTHLQDEIDATRMTIHLESRLLQMENPRGTVSSFLFSGHPDQLCTFSSHSLTWDDKANVMTLEEEILIEDDLLGTLTGEETIQFFQREQFGRYVIQTIESHGKTTLTSESQRLTSFGTLRLDRDNLLLSAKSPVISGLVPLEKQLIYEKGNLTLFADEATLEYTFYQMGLEPKAVILNGHVRLLSNDPESPLQCGIADTASYDPKTKEVRLLSDEGKEVLFWHEEQNLKLSAQEIVIFEDPETNAETIKGIGTVRFSFNDEEQEMLHQLFPSYKKENL